MTNRSEPDDIPPGVAPEVWERARAEGRAMVVVPPVSGRPVPQALRPIAACGRFVALTLRTLPYRLGGRRPPTVREDDFRPDDPAD